MAYLDILQQLAEAGLLRPKDSESTPYYLAKPGGGDQVPPPEADSVPPDKVEPPAPVPAPSRSASALLAPTEFPAGMRDEDLAQAQRSDTASRLALGGANAVLAGAGVQGGGFRPSDYAGDIIQRRKAIQQGQELDEKGLDLAGKRTAMATQLAQQRALLDPAVIESQRRQIAWDVASSQKGGGIPTPEEIDRSYAVVSRWQPAALPTLAESAIKRNKERATANKDYEEAYRANQAGQKEAAEAKELPANDAANRTEKYAIAAWHRAQATNIGKGGGGAGSANDVQSIADGIEGGVLPPDLKRINPKVATPVQAELVRRGFNLSKSTSTWNATQQHMKTMNSSRVTMWRMAIHNVREQLDVVEEAYKQWEAAGGPGRFKKINSATLIGAQNLGDGKLAQASAYLDGTLTALVDKSGKAIMGGGTPTDEALRLAQRLVSSDLPPNQFKMKLKALRADVAAGSNALEQSEPAAVGGNTQYAPDVEPKSAPIGTSPAGDKYLGSPAPAPAGPKPTHRYNPVTRKVEVING